MMRKRVFRLILLLCGLALFWWSAGRGVRACSGGCASICTGSMNCSSQSATECLVNGGTVDECCVLDCTGCSGAGWGNCSCGVGGCSLFGMGAKTCGQCGSGPGCSGTCSLPGVTPTIPPPEEGGYCSDGSRPWCKDTACGPGCTEIDDKGYCAPSTPIGCCCTTFGGLCTNVVYGTPGYACATHVRSCEAPSSTFCLDAEARDNCGNTNNPGIRVNGVNYPAINCDCGNWLGHFCCTGGQYPYRTGDVVNLSRPGMHVEYALTFNDGTCICNSTAFDIRPDPIANLQYVCSADAQWMSLIWNDPLQGTADFYSLRVNSWANGWSGDCSSLFPGDLCADVTDSVSSSFNSHAFAVTPSQTYSVWIDSRTSYQGCWGTSVGLSGISCTPAPMTWVIQPELVCPAGAIFTIPASETHDELSAALQINAVNTFYPSVSARNPLPPYSVTSNQLAQTLSFGLESPTSSGYGFLEPVAPPPAGLSIDSVFPRLGDPDAFQWDRDDLPNPFIDPDYTLSYNAPSAWCCTPTSPTVSAELPSGQLLGDDPFSGVNFNWEVSSWGEDCTETDGRHFWIYVSTTFKDKNNSLVAAAQTDSNLENPIAVGTDTFRVAKIDSTSGCSPIPGGLSCSLDDQNLLSLDTLGIVIPDQNLYWTVVASNDCADTDKTTCYQVDSEFFIDLTSSGWYQSAVGDVYAETSISNAIPDWQASGCGLNNFMSNVSPVGSGPGFVYCRDSLVLSAGDDPLNTVVSSAQWYSHNVSEDLTNDYNYAYFEEKFAGSMTEYSSDSLDLATVMSGETAMVLHHPGSNPLIIEAGAGPLDLTQDQSLVLLVDGDVRITGNITLGESGDGSEIGFLAIFAGGDIVVNGEVGSLEGVYVTDLIFQTCQQQACSPFDSPFDVSGLVNLNAQGIFVANGGFKLYRNTLNQCVPSEVFTYRPEYLLFAPIDFWRLPQTWKELAP